MKILGKTFHLIIPADEMERRYEKGRKRAEELFAKEQSGEKLTLGEKFEIWNDFSVDSAIRDLRKKHKKTLES